MNSSQLHSRSASQIKWVLPFLFLLTLLPLIFAQESVHLTYNLREAETGKSITNMTVQIKETNLKTDKVLSITEYLATNTADVYLAPGEYRIEFIIDDIDTPGKDYYYSESIQVTDDKENTVYAFPVASLRGTVVDKLNNIVNGAEIKLDCDKDYVARVNITTDKYGSFNTPIVPTGNCIIIAVYKDFHDQQEVAFNHGDFESIDLALNTQTNSSFALFGLILLISVIALASVVMWLRLRHDKEHEQDELFNKHLEIKKPVRTRNASKSVKSLPSRVKDILPTLRDREKSIVQFLLDHDGTSSQSRIRFETKIPKTSLSRTFESLKAKNIVEIESFGKLKKIKLTKWFLEK